MQNRKTVPLPDVHSLPEDTRKLLERLPALNIFKMVAHLPSSLPPFVEFPQSFFDDGGVDQRLLEIGILRVAHLNHCAYQWHQHETISKSIGISERELNLIRTEPVVKSLSPQENFICTIADELTKTAKLSDKTFDELFNKYSARQGITIILCISFYNTVSRFLNATRVQIEENNPLEGKTSPVN